MLDKFKKMNDRLGNPNRHSIDIRRNISKEKKEMSIQINTGITLSRTEDSPQTEKVDNVSSRINKDRSTSIHILLKLNKVIHKFSGKESPNSSQ